MGQAFQASLLITACISLSLGIHQKAEGKERINFFKFLFSFTCNPNKVMRWAPTSPS